MKKLLLIFALAGVVSAGAASRACAYWALAFNDATGVANWAWNDNTLEGAQKTALKGLPGGHIQFSDYARGFYVHEVGSEIDVSLKPCP